MNLSLSASSGGFDSKKTARFLLEEIAIENIECFALLIALHTTLHINKIMTCISFFICSVVILPMTPALFLVDVRLLTLFPMGEFLALTGQNTSGKKNPLQL